MLPRFALAAVLASSLVGHGWAQTPSSGSVISRPLAEKPKSAPCHIGGSPIAGNLFLVQRFGDGRVATEGWGLDELVVSRVRAAAPGRSVQRVPFTATELIGEAQRPSFFRDKLKEF